MTINLMDFLNFITYVGFMTLYLTLRGNMYMCLNIITMDYIWDFMTLGVNILWFLTSHCAGFMAWFSIMNLLNFLVICPYVGIMGFMTLDIMIMYLIKNILGSIWDFMTFI